MTKSINAKALGAFKNLGAVALITATIFFVACNQTGGGGGKPTPTPKHAITFSVDSTTPNGTLKATVGGAEISSGDKVGQDKTIVFTATPDSGFHVKGWTLDGNAVNGTNNSYSFTVTKPATVKVSFEAIPKHAITFNVDSTTPNGTLKAIVSDKEINSWDEVEEGKEVTFTATANDGYRVKGWTLDGNAVNGTNTEYKLTVTKPATVKVSFELPSVEGGAVLILSPDKLNIKVCAKTADGSAITVEGCNEATLASDTETTLTATGTTVILKGKITELYCNGSSGNRQSLTALNVQGCASLQGLNCGWNQLTSLNVQGLTALQVLNCEYNKLTALDVQGCTALQKLECRDNKLTALDVQGLTSLQTLECGYNKLTTLDVQGLTVLRTLQCYGNHQLTALNVQGCTSLQKLDCRSNQLTALDVQGLTSLQTLECWTNKLTALNVQGLTSLKELKCSSNQLPELNVQGLTSLQTLECAYNQLTALNVQGLTALQTLECRYNNITALNVQGLTALKNLECYANKLNAQAMTELLKGLPTREESDGAFAVLYTEETGKPEENCKDYNTPEDLKKAFEGAKSRNWKLKKVKAGGRWENL